MWGKNGDSWRLFTRTQDSCTTTTANRQVFFLEKYPKLVIAALEAISKTASTKLDSGGMLRKQYQNKGTGIFGNSKGTGTKGTSTHRNLSNKINGDTMRPF